MRENTHPRSIRWTDRLCLGTVTIRDKRDHGSEGQCEGVHARLWKKKRKGRNVIIKS